MLAKQILNLLEIQSKVIVPDLGAFLIKIDESHHIFFNEFLRFNDGMLVDYIAQTENIDTMDAAKIVKNFVDVVNKTLITAKAYELDGIGTLIYDNNGKISLIPSTLKSEVTENLPEEKSDLQIPQQKSEIQEKVIDYQIVSEPPPSNVDAFTESQKQVTSENIKWDERPVSGKVIIPITKSIEQEESNTGGIVELFSNNASWIIPFILILIMASAYFIFFRSPSKTSQPIIITEDTTKTDTASKDTPQDSLFNKVNNLENSVSKTKNTNNSSKPKVTNTKMYYLVAGCFAIESNADRLVSKLRKQGYDSKKINKIGSGYYVSLKSFDDKLVASKELKKIKEATNIDAWIIYY